MVLMRSDDGGLELLEYHPGEKRLLEDIPLIFTLVVPEYEGKTLLLYTSERHQWEYPGGALEPGADFCQDDGVDDQRGLATQAGQLVERPIRPLGIVSQNINEDAAIHQRGHRPRRDEVAGIRLPRCDKG